MVRAAGAALLLLAATAAQAQGDWRNLTAGGPLRHGVYGRIEVRGAQPPLIYAQPVVASQPVGVSLQQPMYLYVPPGQVRKWDRYCLKWQACDQPVLFVRMDNSPSRLGQWKYREERPGMPDTAVLGASPAPLVEPASRSSLR